jgi:site-specific recombinase XerD
MVPSSFSFTWAMFKGLIPRMPRFHADLEDAGIAPEDEQGRKADFHSLRNTFATVLTLNGKPQREIMELKRHSDMRLAAKVYTDAGQFPRFKQGLHCRASMA